jgi:hypothetical protein
MIYDIKLIYTICTSLSVVRNALLSDITAESIIEYLVQNSHQVVKKSAINKLGSNNKNNMEDENETDVINNVIPVSVRTQIMLWQQERTRHSVMFLLLIYI